MKILVVEDDALMGRALHSGLKSAYTTDWVTCAEDAETALLTSDYDLMVLDINLPGISGLELLGILRRRRQKLPVLLLTARDTVAQRIEGLDAGGDDYLVKPFDFDELLARIRALLRRGDGYNGHALVHGDITLDTRARRVTRNGATVPMSRTEFEILALLLQNAGIYFSKDRIEDKIYGWDDLVSSNTVEVHISALRRKLGKTLIKTTRGIGYVIEKADR